jgi:shikimate kinase
MKIAVCGYMGSGKSTVSQFLASQLQLNLIDLDNELEKEENLSISEIFQQKGEIYFRERENFKLKEILNSQKSGVISLGGGTPCYANNLQLLKSEKDLKMVYLKLSSQSLTERLWNESNTRPVIAHLDSKEKLEDFIRKHLFERQFDYLQSDYIIDANHKPIKDIGQEIIKLFY